MRITKFGHACVRIEHDGKVVVVDPGAFTDAEAVDGATAVLVTHEHPTTSTSTTSAPPTRRSSPSRRSAPRSRRATRRSPSGSRSSRPASSSTPGCR